jgi:ADP-heptose:LPS heptosyltransferase
MVAASRRPDKIVGLARHPGARELCGHVLLVRGPHHALHRWTGIWSWWQPLARRISCERFPLPTGKPEGILPEGPSCLACPLAGWGAKQWPLDHYTELANGLSLPLV